MQNLPRGSEIRKSVAPEGRLVYVADLSNIEARVLAWLADEQDLLQAFALDEDVYSQFATQVFGREINKYDHPEERFVGKTAILGLGYGMGANKFQVTLESGAMGPPMMFTNKQAQEVVSTYRTTCRGSRVLVAYVEHVVMDFRQIQIQPAFQVSHIFNTRSNRITKWYEASLSNLQPLGDKYRYTFRGKHEYTWGGKITENIVQALSRIVITDGLMRIHIPRGPGRFGCTNSP